MIGWGWVKERIYPHSIIMKSYHQMSYSEFIRIETLLEEGYNGAEIAVKLGRNKSSIYRCLQQTDEAGRFNADAIWQQIQEHKHRANSHPRILGNEMLRRYIVEKIQAYWSPEQIAGRWREEQAESLSHETIYQFIYRHHPQFIRLYLRRKGKKYQHKRKEKYQIMDRRMIDERPQSVEQRLVAGHWEGDTIVGRNHQQGIVTNVERKSGYLIAGKVPQRTAEAILESTKELFASIPPQLKLTITYDNGREFAWHKLIEYETKMTVYFAHAYSPWERGTNENTNGLLRQYIPKGTDLDTITEEQLQQYVHLINNRPRKRHNWLTPYELFFNHLPS